MFRINACDRLLNTDKKFDVTFLLKLTTDHKTFVTILHTNIVVGKGFVLQL